MQNSQVQSAAAIATLLGFTTGGTLKHGMIQVVRWLRGRKIDKIETTDSITSIHIDGEAIETEEKVLRLLKNERIRKALEEAIKKHWNVRASTPSASPPESPTR